MKKLILMLLLTAFVSLAVTSQSRIMLGKNATPVEILKYYTPAVAAGVVEVSVYNGTEVGITGFNMFVTLTDKPSDYHSILYMFDEDLKCSINIVQYKPAEIVTLIKWLDANTTFAGNNEWYCSNFHYMLEHTPTGKILVYVIERTK